MGGEGSLPAIARKRDPPAPVPDASGPTETESDRPTAERAEFAQRHMRSSVGPEARRHGRVARATHFSNTLSDKLLIRRDGHRLARRLSNQGRPITSCRRPPEASK